MKKNKNILIIVSGITIAFIIILVYLFSIRKDRNNNNINNISHNPTVIKNNTTTDNEDSLKVEYTEKNVRELSVGNTKYTCIENIPNITGVDENVAKKMEEYLKNWYSQVMTDISNQTEDSEINRILQSGNNNDLSQSYQVVLKTDKIITFKYNTDKGLGGACWKNSIGVSFNRATGDVIDLEDVVISRNDYINTCKKYIREQLKNNQIAQYLNSDYETVIDEAVENMSGYFTKDGIVCAEIPGKLISEGASGEFEFTIPYELVKSYIYSNYVIE